MAEESLVHNLAKLKNVAFKLYFMLNCGVCNRQKSQAALKLTAFAWA
jgi:hypothetical protein